jgi:hypothetical protein
VSVHHTTCHPSGRSQPSLWKYRSSALVVSLRLLALSACGGAGATPSDTVLPAVVPPAETWIISGQSNAVGCARGTSVDDARVQMWTGAGWLPAHEPLAFMEPFEGCQVGPWLQAARAVGRPVRLTGWGKVGISISNWNPQTDGWRRLEHAIKSSGLGASWFLWFQGEADAVGKGTQAPYADRLTDLIARVRRAAQNPSMRVLIVGLADAPFQHFAAGYTQVRLAQEEVAARDPLTVYVSAEGLPTAASQPYHLTEASYRVLGVRIAAIVR